MLRRVPEVALHRAGQILLISIYSTGIKDPLSFKGLDVPLFKLAFPLQCCCLLASPGDVSLLFHSSADYF